MNMLKINGQFGTFTKGYDIYTFTIARDAFGWFCKCIKKNNTNVPNYQILYDHGFETAVSRYSFFEKVLGYKINSGFWPYCKSYNDVIKVLAVLSDDHFINLRFFLK